MAWDEEQRANAATIARIGRSLGATSRDILIGLMTAMQESGLRNLNYGDRDSVGLFQQRDAWGTHEQRTNPAEAARMFFQGGHAGQRGLFSFANRDQMSLAQAAQSVQVSAFPDAYAKHESTMRSLLKDLGVDTGIAKDSTLGQVPDLDALLQEAPQVQSFDAPSVLEVNGIGEITADDVGLGEQQFGQPASPLDATSFSMATNDPMKKAHLPTLEELGIDVDGNPVTVTEGVSDAGPSLAPKGMLDFAKKFLGTPYVWGGTSPSGFDCSGLVQYVYGKYGIKLPRLSADQARSGARVGLDDLKPGDLVAWDNSSRNNGADHIAIYIGNGQIIEAPRPGAAVQINTIYDSDNAWGVRIKR